MRENSEKFVIAHKKVKQAIFPIFRLLQTQTGLQLDAKAAGFFLDNQGRFATCAHLFDDAPPGATFEYFGHLPHQLQIPPIRVKELGRSDVGDIVIGRLTMPNPTGFLHLGSGLPEPGKQVCIFGYPMALKENAQCGVQFGGVRHYLQRSFVLDSVTATPKNSHRTHNGFSVRDTGYSGVSGGPVVDVEGRVVGMLIAVLTQEDKAGPHTNVVHNAIVVGVDYVRAAYEEVMGNDDNDNVANLPMCALST